MKSFLFVAFLFGLVSCKNKDTDGPEKPDPNATKIMNNSIINTYPHDTSSYTQGLLIYKGELYEGTGLEGKSRLMKVELKTGKTLQRIDLDEKYFGEGVAILNDTVYQLTWKNKVVFVYTLKDFKKSKRIYH